VILSLSCVNGTIKKMGRAKHMFWFRVGEEDKTICDNVDESLVLENVVEGPPASGCEQDGERFCMCGKLGPNTRRNWTFFCGRCRKNEPYSFKVELGKFKKTKKNGKKKKKK